MFELRSRLAGMIFPINNHISGIPHPDRRCKTLQDNISPEKNCVD
jgi:hypothetical protein